MPKPKLPAAGKMGYMGVDPRMYPNTMPCIVKRPLRKTKSSIAVTIALVNNTLPIK